MVVFFRADLFGKSGGIGEITVPTLIRTSQSMCSDDTVRFVDFLAQARAGDVATLGNLLDRYRNYLALLARLQIGRRLQGKMDPVDLVTRS